MKDYTIDEVVKREWGGDVASGKMLGSTYNLGIGRHNWVFALFSESVEPWKGPALVNMSGQLSMWPCGERVPHEELLDQIVGVVKVALR